MSEPYDWKKNFHKSRADGCEVVEVRHTNDGGLSVSAWGRDSRFEAYEVLLDGKAVDRTQSFRDLLPIEREPVLVPWESVLILPPTAIYRRKCERFGYSIRRIDYERHEVGLTDNTTVTLTELAEEFVYIQMGGLGTNWLPCGTLETPK